MKKNILCIAILLFSVQAFAQQKRHYKEMIDDMSINFYDVCKAAEEHFKTIDITQKGSGYKGYIRWKENNEYKYAPSGRRDNIDHFLPQKEFDRIKRENQTSNKLFENGWEELGPRTIDSITGHYAAGLGRIEDFYVDPTNDDNLYLGSRSGGFWKSNDGGNNWAVTTDFLVASGVNAIGVSPTNKDSVLINVQNANNQYSHGIYRSTNGGNAWTQTNFNPTTLGFGGLGSNFRIYEIAYHPTISNLIFIATSRGLFRSADNLQTWTSIFGGNDDITDMAFHPTNPNIVYVYNRDGGFSNNVLYSTDAGQNFVASSTLVNNGGTTNLEISTSSDCPNCVYAATTNGVWRSTDNGQNFTFISVPTSTCRGFAVNDLDTSVMIYGYVDIENSTDGGQNWNQITYWSLGNTNGSGNGLHNSFFTSTDYVHADLRNAKCINGDFYVSTDGYLCKSTDNGATWIRLSNNNGIRENYRLGVSQSNHERVAIGSQDNGMSIHTESGWIEFYGADGMEAVIHPLNDDWMLTSLQFGSRRRTLDGGLTQSSGTPNNSNQGDWLAPLFIDPNNHMRIIDIRDEVYESLDFGDNHTTLNAPSFAGNVRRAAIAQNNSDIMIASRYQNIEKTINGGVSWSSIRNNLPTGFSVESIAFAPHDDNIICVTSSSYQNNGQKIYISYDGGGSWQNITNNLGNMPLRSVIIDHTPAHNIYVGAEIGIFSMPLNGNLWMAYNIDLPNTAVLELDINNGSNTLKAATWGRGLWEYALIGRKNYPAILKTSITSQPTLDRPKKGVDQTVTSIITYDNSLSDVFVRWSANNLNFNNVISMTNTIDSTWKSNSPLPDLNVGDKIYFKVFAVGDNQDTTETYKFMYEIHPFDYCAATGHDNDGNLFIDSVAFESINNITTNDAYTNYSTPIPTIFADSTYSIFTSANTGWQENDFGAWIDFNKDAEFSDDERILWDLNTGSNADNTFTVPTIVAVGDTVTMRVRLSYWGSLPRPCGTQFGEVEDYKVLLQSNGTPVNIASLDKTEKLSVYPNPVSDKLFIVSQYSDKQAYTIINQTGQGVLKGQLLNGKNSIDLDHLVQGIYILKVNSSIYKILKD